MKRSWKSQSREWDVNTDAWRRGTEVWVKSRMSTSWYNCLNIVASFSCCTWTLIFQRGLDGAMRHSFERIRLETMGFEILYSLCNGAIREYVESMTKARRWPSNGDSLEFRDITSPPPSLPLPQRWHFYPVAKYISAFRTTLCKHAVDEDVDSFFLLLFCFSFLFRFAKRT